MHRERVSDNVYWFQSNVYAQVTAGVVVGPKWAVLIDTLALPEESIAIRDFVEREIQTKIRYIINTHYHADHSWGNCFFPERPILGDCTRYENLAAHRKQDGRANAYRRSKTSHLRRLCSALGSHRV